MFSLITYYHLTRPSTYSFSSQKYLSSKYGIEYTTDRWHEGQRDEALEGLVLKASDGPGGGGGGGGGGGSIGGDPVEQATLVLCFMIAVGCNRFVLDMDAGQARGQRVDPAQGSGIGVVEALKSLPDAMKAQASGDLTLRCWCEQSHEFPLAAEGTKTAKVSLGGTTAVLAWRRLRP